MKEKDIGLGIKSPKKTCDDDKCPFHGNVTIRGRIFVGTVISAKMQRTVNVEFIMKIKIQKYERYSEKRTRVKAHNPDCIKATEGDIVKIMESRPLSKTVNFVVVEKISGEEKSESDKSKKINDKSKNNEGKLEVEE